MTISTSLFACMRAAAFLMRSILPYRNLRANPPSLKSHCPCLFFHEAHNGSAPPPFAVQTSSFLIKSPFREKEIPIGNPPPFFHMYCFDINILPQKSRSAAEICGTTLFFSLFFYCVPLTMISGTASWIISLSTSFSSVTSPLIRVMRMVLFFCLPCPAG